MELQLKNIGMIKEANVKLDGLTIIAGENDTGKSTVGKALFMFLHSFKFVHNTLCSVDGNINNKNMKNYLEKENRLHEAKEQYLLPQLIFNNQVSNTEFILRDENNIISLYLDKDNKIGVSENCVYSKDTDPLSPIIIETPLVWNFTKLFKDLSLIESQMNIDIDYPFLMKDLNFKLSIKSKSKGIDIKNELVSLVNGEFKQDEKGEFFFIRDEKKIDLINTATGIKYFGIFQVLSENNYLNKNTLLVLDEPEVHLHPKWQLEMAKIIVELVKNDVKILVNSHSPYMIEALQRYSEIAKIGDKTNFYLAEDGKIDKVDNSNSLTLSQIFKKLSDPFDVFDQMDSEALQNG